MSNDAPYRLVYEVTLQLCLIGVLSSSDKDHRAHGLQREVKAHKQEVKAHQHEVRSWSSGQGCTFIKVIKVIYWPTPLSL